MNFFGKYSLQKKSKTRGFSLIEMIVVISIVTITSSLVLWNYRGSKDNTLLSSTAIDIATLLKIAQTGGRSATENITDYTGITNNIDNRSLNLRTGVRIKFNEKTASEATNINEILVYKESGSSFGYNEGVGFVITKKK